MTNNLALELGDVEKASSFLEKLHIAWDYMPKFEILFIGFILIVIFLSIIIFLTPKNLIFIPIFATSAIIYQTSVFSMGGISLIQGTGSFETKPFTIETAYPYSDSYSRNNYKLVDLKTKGNDVIRVDILSEDLKNISPDSKYKLVTNEMIIEKHMKTPKLTRSALRLKKIE